MIYDGSPPQGPSRGTAGQVRITGKPQLRPPRGALRGGGNYHNRGYGGISPHNVFNNSCDKN